MTRLVLLLPAMLSMSSVTATQSALVAIAQPSSEMVAKPSAPAPQATDLRPEEDGLFYIDARVNGAPIRFVVDTGASVVVLTPQDARAAGIADDLTSMAHVETAAGAASMRRVTLDRVQVAGTRLDAVDAAVTSANLRVSLLGQSALSRLDGLTIRGGSLHID